MQPVPQGFIQLLDSASFQVAATFCDEKGLFTLKAPGPGEYLIQVEAFSYHSMQDGPVTLRSADTLGVEFFVLPDPPELDPLIIEAERTDFRLRTSGFYRRQRRLMGQFITREEIDDIRPHDFTSLVVWGAIGVWMRPNRVGYMVPAFSAGRSSTRASGAGWCFPMYYLDGHPFLLVHEYGGIPVYPNEVAAVEAYATQAETPAEYRSLRARCGTILIWTRYYGGVLPACANPCAKTHGCWRLLRTYRPPSPVVRGSPATKPAW